MIFVILGIILLAIATLFAWPAVVMKKTGVFKKGLAVLLVIASALFYIAGGKELMLVKSMYDVNPNFESDMKLMTSKKAGMGLYDLKKAKRLHDPVLAKQAASELRASIAEYRKERPHPNGFERDMIKDQINSLNQAEELAKTAE